MRKRGRPKLQMTHRRRQVLGYIQERARVGDRITLRRLVRECGIYDNRTAKRVLNDLRAMGALA